MSITLYEFSKSRSARVRWTLAELGVDYDSIEDRALFGSDEIKKVHPLGKLPAIVDDGRALFESAAICTWLADKHADKGLIAPSGMWERALHDQWTCFMLTEIEAYVWHSAQNMFVYREKHRLPAVFPQNERQAKRGLSVLDQHLATDDYLVGGRFSVTDIIAGYTVNWARGALSGFPDEFPHVNAYWERLVARPQCPFGAE